MKNPILKIVLLALLATNTSHASNNVLYIYTNLQTPELAEESISLLQCLSNNVQIQWDLVMSKSSEYLPRLEIDEIDEKTIQATLRSSETEAEKTKINKNDLTKELCNKIAKNKKLNTGNPSGEINLQPKNNPQETSPLNESYADIEQSQKTILPWVVGGALLVIGGILLAKKLSAPSGGNTTIVTQ